MKASEAIYITCEKWRGVHESKEWWLAGWGSPPPGGWVYDLGEIRFGLFASVRTIGPLDLALEAQAVNVTPEVT